MLVKSKIKRFLLPYACQAFLTHRKFFCTEQKVKEMHCALQDIKLITTTSNNIMQIDVDCETLYFRECKVHKEIHQYVADEIEYYYTQIRPDLAEDRRFIEGALSIAKNFRKFINMGMVNDRTSGAYRFCKGENGECIGLSGTDEEQAKRLRDFVLFIWGELFAYKLNKGIEIGQYQTYNAVRSIGFYRIAKLMHVEELVPETEFAVLHIGDSQKIFGTLMKQAYGASVEKESTEYRKQICSPQLQHALNNLNMIDVMCFEKDHRVGNYTVAINGGKAVSVQAFDNDSPNSFGLGGAGFRTYIGCSCWLHNKQMNRPYVDRHLAKRILDIDMKEVSAAVGDLLNSYQLFALRHRIRAMQKALLTVSEDRWLDDDEWNELTMHRELSGEYGHTYLVEFLCDQKRG